MATKRTGDLIPLCHPLALTSVKVDLSINEAEHRVEIEAEVANRRADRCRDGSLDRCFCRWFDSLRYVQVSRQRDGDFRYSTGQKDWREKWNIYSEGVTMMRGKKEKAVKGRKRKNGKIKRKGKDLSRNMPGSLSLERCAIVSGILQRRKDFSFFFPTLHLCDIALNSARFLVFLVFSFSPLLTFCFWYLPDFELRSVDHTGCLCRRLRAYHWRRRR